MPPLSESHRHVSRSKKNKANRGTASKTCPVDSFPAFRKVSCARRMATQFCDQNKLRGAKKTKHTEVGNAIFVPISSHRLSAMLKIILQCPSTCRPVSFFSRLSGNARLGFGLTRGYRYASFLNCTALHKYAICYIFFCFFLRHFFLRDVPQENECIQCALGGARRGT